MDMYWVEHLEVMDYMRSSVNLRAYGQRDPLVEYKKEGLQLFKTMEISIAQEILKLIPQIQPRVNFFNAPVKLTETRENAESINSEVVASSSSGPKVGRNDPCPCGAINPETSKVYKYKQCGMINAPYHKG